LILLPKLPPSIPPPPSAFPPLYHCQRIDSSGLLRLDASGHAHCRHDLPRQSWTTCGTWGAWRTWGELFFLDLLTKRVVSRRQRPTNGNTFPTYPWFNFQQTHNAPLPPLPELYANEGGIDTLDYNVHYSPLALQPCCDNAYPLMPSTHIDGCISSWSDAPLPQGFTSLITNIQPFVGYVCSRAAVMTS
jgi:hypothetical protein